MSTSYFEVSQNSLICGYHFSPEQSGRPIETGEALALLNGEQASDDASFIWLHFDLTKAAAEKWMREHLNLPDEYYEALVVGSRSTRIEDVSDNLIAVMNDVSFEFTFDPSEMSTLWVSVSQRLLVSARTHPLSSVDQLRVAVKQGVRFSSSVALLIYLFRVQEDLLVKIMRDATLQIDAIEDKLLIGELAAKRADLGRLRRVLVRLQRLLAPEPTALFRLLHQPPLWISENDLDELRQSTEEFSLVIRDLAALQERIKLLQEEMAAQIGEQTNRSLFTLTIVTVLALPINIIAGLFGMNVGGIPLSQNPYGFLTIVLVVISFTIIAAWLAFRKKR
ncbi:MAG TPA: transporter [Methylophilaceae bacterium]|jgi:zinc transporter